MRRTIYLLAAGTTAGSALLIAYSPDPLSMAIAAVMLVLVSAGLIFGVLPLASASGGLARGIANVESSEGVKASTPMDALSTYDVMFGQAFLDSAFEEYRSRVEEQAAEGKILSDIDEYVNEEFVSLRCWNPVVMQIPGTLTGLGLLGTFVGLITGISEIGFSSVDAALTSVQTLLDGIRVAFYTSIAGVILSILFNVTHKMAWSVMARQLGTFTSEFRRRVVPSPEEQERDSLAKYRKTTLDRLDRLPKNPGFSLASMQSGANPSATARNAQILMPQISEGLKNGEFVFVLQPKYDLTSGRMTSAESFVRWRHGKLGTVSPGVFLPIVEENGYITKLDGYVWDSVFAAVRKWIDEGVRLVPIAVNVSKTDVLAGDVVETFDAMTKKYKIPPRMIDVEIAENAFTEAGDLAVRTSSELRDRGFKVIVDGFDGDFVPLGSVQGLEVDEVKFDIRRLDMKRDADYIKGVLAKGREMTYGVTVEGIETMEQASFLRKNGCAVGQGYHYSKPISQDEFIEKCKE